MPDIAGTTATRSQSILIKTNSPNADDQPTGAGWYTRQLPTDQHTPSPWDAAHTAVDLGHQAKQQNWYGAPSEKAFKANPFYWINHQAGGNI